MHATIWKEMIDTFKPNIKELSTYSIKNFKVQPVNIYRPINSDVKIAFMFNTAVKELNTSLDILPNYYFEFATKETLSERKNKSTYCSGMLFYVYNFKI